MSANEIDRQIRAAFQAMQPKFRDEVIMITGYVDPATGTIASDPLIGLPDGQVWCHDDVLRSSVPCLIGEGMRNYTRSAGVRCETGINRSGLRVAIQPVADAINAAINAQYYNANALSRPIPAANITDGICLPPDGGGLFIYVGALDRLGWGGGVIAVDSGDVPTNPTEQRWLVVYHPGSFGATPTYATAGPHTLPGNQGLLISEAAAVVLPVGSFRLFAVSLGYGTSDILASNTRLVDLRDWLTPRGVGFIQSIVAGTNVTVDNTDPTNPIVSATPGGGGSALDLIILKDLKTQNTDGGTFTSGAWQTRTLNTKTADTGSNCTLSSNQFALLAGTYRIIARAPAHAVDRNQARLYNITDSAVQQDTGGNDLLSESVFAANASNSGSLAIIDGRFTISGTKTFELQHQCQTTESSNGFGVAGNFAQECYAVVRLEKE